jgi:hypothetical protein
MRAYRWLPAMVAATVLVVVFFATTRDAGAVPSFARKYQTSCLTCHTVYPVLNPFGEAFRRNGYRFPSQNGSVDSDAVKSNMIAMGQEEYKKTFPDSVWPDSIADAVPLSVMANGRVGVNLPNSDAQNPAGAPFPQTFTWGGIAGEIHLFGAGSFSDSLTYFAQVTIPDGGAVDIETAYLLWNDILGPAHLVNLWVGRLMSPQLASFGLHSSYLADTFTPAVSVAGLYSPSTRILGQGHTDGVELNGIVAHRFAWSLGWVASSSALGLPDAEDFYAHVGIKSGGVALDGEGKYGPNVPDPRKPWAEKSITFDVFAYHGLSVLDNGTGVATGFTPTPVAQKDRFNAVGGSIHGQYDSLIVTAGLQFELHGSPYAGTQATPAAAGGAPTPGAADLTRSGSIVQYDEIDYVVWPWFVPAVRAELTRTTFESAAAPGVSNPASLLRIIPGIAMLVRPNIKVVVTGDLERAYGLPPVGTWASAGGNVVAPGPGLSSMFEAEQINTTVAIAF